MGYSQMVLKRKERAHEQMEGAPASHKEDSFVTNDASVAAEGGGVLEFNHEVNSPEAPARGRRPQDHVAANHNATPNASGSWGLEGTPAPAAPAATPSARGQPQSEVLTPLTVSKVHNCTFLVVLCCKVKCLAFLWDLSKCVLYP
jgi:hypothetical protein